MSAVWLATPQLVRSNILITLPLLGMALSEPGDAAPTGLEEFVWGTITINMLLLRSLKVLSAVEGLDVAADRNVRAFGSRLRSWFGLMFRSRCHLRHGIVGTRRCRPDGA